MTGYNGWKNYETWNVALFLHGRDYNEGYEELKQELPERTPDGVRFDDPKVNVAEINQMLSEHLDIR